jgi:hypothetical protein
MVSGGIKSIELGLTGGGVHLTRHFAYLPGSHRGIHCVGIVGFFLC